MGGLTARFASRNENKRRELQRAVPGWELELLDAEFPPETGESYYDNALAKARFGHERVGGWVLGEDSGIEAEGLGGRPGLHSSREGGSDPQWLLRELRGIENRRARYVCELVAIDPEGREYRGTGILAGAITHEARGSAGFGYDPVFVPEGEERTVAELGNEWKAENSHRSRAAKALAEAIRRGPPPSPPAQPRAGRGGTS